MGFVEDEKGGITVVRVLVKSPIVITDEDFYLWCIVNGAAITLSAKPTGDMVVQISGELKIAGKSGTVTTTLRQLLSRCRTKFFSGLVHN